MQNDECAWRDVLLDDDDVAKKQLAVLLDKRRRLHEVSPASLVVPPVGDSGSKTTEVITAAATSNVLSSPPPCTTYALVVVSCTFRHVASLSDKTKDIATRLFHALVDASFSRCNRRGSRLLVNPSLIEFQDTLQELASVCERDASLVSHGARVTKGVNKGSYILFSESRLSSEAELLLTALHENELARLLHAIPCRNKLVTLDLCHVHEPNEQPLDVADAIRNRIYPAFASRLYTTLKQLGTQQSSSSSSSATALPHQLLVLSACDLTTQVSLTSADDSVSTFLHRLNDAFRGAAVAQELDLEKNDSDRQALPARVVVAYICTTVTNDAAIQNARVKDAYNQQARTRYEQAAEFHELQQTPYVLGIDDDSATAVGDFSVGVVPVPPTLAPTPPTLVSATLNSLTIAWTFVRPAAVGLDLPVILGFHVQRRGSGRVESDSNNSWKRAAAFQVLRFDDVVRAKQAPPTCVRVNGLATDLGYCFRVRARTAGGWGPFSAASAIFTTLSVASVHDQHATVQRALQTHGAPGVLALMRTHAAVRGVQRQCIEELAKLALPPRTRRERPALLPALDVSIVHQVGVAMQTFRRDYVLQTHASRFIGRLCATSDDWRRVIQACKAPDIAALVQDAARRFDAIDAETVATSNWATARIRGDAVCGIQRCHRPADAESAAARRIQGLFRMRKARATTRALAQAVYQSAIDPTTGQSYYYNSRTGASTWSLPAFLA